MGFSLHRPQKGRTAAERLGTLIDGRGIPEFHRQIADRMGVQPQYLSDVKQGRRPLAKLFARGFDEEFAVNHEWLPGAVKEMAQAKTSARDVTARSGLPLPLFSEPIVGEPTADPNWNGSTTSCGR
jgi:hypothetical protein